MDAYINGNRPLTGLSCIFFDMGGEKVRKRNRPLTGLSCIPAWTRYKSGNKVTVPSRG